MTTIDTETDVTTLINVFTVVPERQDELVDLLADATEETMRHLPGFVSANIHRSRDGERVVNYAQWESEADYEAIFERPDVREHMDGALELATADYHLYDVALTDER
ncbi:tetracenomycin polyketide synthesis hydroxylase TcmH [Haladaptatus paucihalophilus DX253]|uniref:Quinol monooxygenase YgiN n=1 Tax=Haladaptatus paucihalophilus DX253 TaxID=797209 RepID=E7QY43_HALPU|nr:antibiotic biosynthesis monooxygenase family protein [Haladaptatus paucihalophilus]EFW90509.1 tetracenomycin polyketide synthesis hydroxylase TcmH [Haladaptatus paucihalophilus DX253]SHK78078.1 Quinol monooxygenase YgiN [Haladaptatus paucihalophilus DX253]